MLAAKIQKNINVFFVITSVSTGNSLNPEGVHKSMMSYVYDLHCKISELLNFSTLSIVRYCGDLKTQSLGNWACFLPQVKGETQILLDSLETAWTSQLIFQRDVKGTCLPPHLRADTNPVSEKQFSEISRIPEVIYAKSKLFLALYTIISTFFVPLQKLLSSL